MPDGAGVALEAVPRRWPGQAVIVAAPGPSLSPQVATVCRRFPTVCVQDAARLFPWAEVLYGCDAAWWRVHRGCREFAGERWSTHEEGGNEKRAVAAEYGLRLVAGRHAPGFSTDPAFINYGHNSGFQAINFALLAGAALIVLVGFDMQPVSGKTHFFGDHPKPLPRREDYGYFIPAFAEAAASLPPGCRILNATPGSALKCFPAVPLGAALEIAADVSRGILAE